MTTITIRTLVFFCTFNFATAIFATAPIPSCAQIAVNAEGYGNYFNFEGEVYRLSHIDGEIANKSTWCQAKRFIEYCQDDAASVDIKETVNFIKDRILKVASCVEAQERLLTVKSLTFYLPCYGDHCGYRALFVENLAPLASLTSLERLSLSNSLAIDLGPLAGLVNLKELTLSNNRIKDISPIKNFKNLRELTLAENYVEDLTAVSSLKRLTYFSFERLGPFYSRYNDRTSLKDTRPLAHLAELTSISIKQSLVSDIDFLRAMPKLKTINLYGNAIKDLTPITLLSQVTELNLISNQITDISPLATLINLKSLELTSNQVMSLMPLAGLMQLEEFYMYYNPLGNEILKTTDNCPSDPSLVAQVIADWCSF